MEIKQNQPDARILVLTSFADDENVAQAIKAGAFGFLLKDTTPDDLVQTIQSVYAKKLTIPQELTHLLFDRSKTLQEPVSSNQDLTHRELDVLAYIAQGLSNNQISQALFISTTTVRTHVSSMIRKLNLNNRTQLALYAKEHDLANGF